MLLKFAIKDYLDEKEFVNLAPRTIKAYGDTLIEFQAFCSDRELIDTEDIRESTLKSYLVYCQKERQNSVLTRNTKLQHLKTFFQFLEDEEVINQKRNPARKLKQAKTETKIEVFSDEQIRMMLRYYRRIKARDKSFWSYRDHTMIVFLLGTGSRLGEMINLKWSDLDLMSQTATLFGKARKQESIPLTDKLTRELYEYRLFVERFRGKLPEYIFTSREGNQLTPNAVKLMFSRLAKIMNFKNVRLSAHTFRHTFAHRCLMAGMDVFTLSKLLRHSNLKMTERYLAIWGTALREQNDKYNPLERMDI
ncbi:tyrosine-type recombinase/integrase [Bacillus pseudomycoides]|uniref:Integrase n=1 Tax=Bacillus pseudomycoides TaxID=64104 RepID=A0A2B4MCQ4_9BACI|nr:tyrosine-type recombinase/integrase [Bacillus pseudomycoides]PEA82459.1 integrase [Bacillus pseudomycoides]PED06950.1 integrase [Bacillus pseudomycoides]PEI98895.1 integrase [Bacillus pseudomycoides]PEK29751.1 integrase [Bacillus pseudomycoides]PEM68266.1 integrase [Bacillus pseudomycoides]